MCQISSHVWASFLSTLLWSLALFSLLLFTLYLFFPSPLPHTGFHSSCDPNPCFPVLQCIHIDISSEREREREREREMGLARRNQGKSTRVTLNSLIHHQKPNRANDLDWSQTWSEHDVSWVQFSASERLSDFQQSIKTLWSQRRLKNTEYKPTFPQTVLG